MLKIKKANNQDIPDLIKLYNEFYIEVEKEIPQNEHVLRVLFSCLTQGLVYIVHDENRAIGILAGIVYKNIFQAECIYVKRKYRGKFSTLYKYALKDGKQIGIDEIRIYSSKETLHFWNKNEFKIYRYLLRRKI